VALVAALGIELTGASGVAMDTSGASYLAGPMIAPTTVDTIVVPIAGTFGLCLAKFDAVTAAPVWANAYGDADVTSVTGVGLTITADGTLAALAQVVGTVNGKQNPRSYPIDFVHAVQAATGTSKWTRMLDSGIGGAMKAITANPALNLIAVCGYVDGTQAAAGADQPIVPAAPFYGGTRDAAIAVFSSATGTKLWSRALDGPAAEECSALAIDGSGNVYAAGKFNGALDFGAGGTPVDGSTTAIGKLWVAKLAAADGSTLADAAFGVSGNTLVNGLALDSAGKLLLAGSFTASTTTPLVFGATSLATAGGTDAWVAKLDPAAGSAFAPLWALRLGGTTADDAKGVAIGPADSVLVVGNHSGLANTTGIAALSAGGAAPNGYLLELKSDGMLLFAATYGDPANQSLTKLATNGTRLSLAGTVTGAGAIDFGGSVVPAVPAGPPTLTSTGASAFIGWGGLR
jgi:hypothetical protein